MLTVASLEQPALIMFLAHRTGDPNCAAQCRAQSVPSAPKIKTSLGLELFGGTGGSGLRPPGCMGGSWRGCVLGVLVGPGQHGLCFREVQVNREGQPRIEGDALA